MNVARFIAFCGKLEYGQSGCIFAYISMTTRARDFKFAGTSVQRLQLVMVALTKKSFSAQYAWFSRGGSHIRNQHCAAFTLYIRNLVYVYLQWAYRPPRSAPCAARRSANSVGGSSVIVATKGTDR